MIHVPLHARDAEFVDKGLKHYMESQSNYVIFVKEVPSQQKEVKIYLRTPQTKNVKVEIDLKPMNGEYPTVLIDNQLMRYSKKEIAKMFDDYIQVYALPHGEVVINIMGEFSVIYDGSRVKVRLDSDRYYNEVRGICGNANAMVADDMRAPEDCILRTSSDLIDAYTLPANTSSTNLKHNQYKSGCYQYNYLYTNVISHDNLESDDLNLSHKGLRSCSKQQTRYMIDRDQVCFTIKPLPQCQPSCRPTKTISRSVPVHCVKKTNVSQLWMMQIDKGASPDFGLKKATKSMSFNVPQSCRQS